MSWQKYEDAAERGPMSFFFKVLGPVLVIVVVLSAIGFAFRMASQPARIAEKTMDADNVIYNYEWFKSRFNGIEAKDSQIADAKAALEAYKEDLGPRRSEDGKNLWTYQDREEYNRLNSIVIGLKQERDSQAAEYNARAKMANRSLFMGKELPERIDIN